MENEISEKMQEEIIDKVETRRPKEPTNKGYYYLVVTVGALFSLFYWLTCGLGSLSSESHRGVYLIFSTVMVFLMFRATLRSKSKNPTVMDIIWSILTIAVIVIWMKIFPNYAMRRVGNPDMIHLVIGALVILISLEAGRRATGYVLPGLALFFLLYAYFGPYIPGMLGHYGFPIARIFEFIGFGMNGIWGVVVNTYASYIFPFIIFASFLGFSGGGKAIEKIAVAVAGGSRGGPAKIAVVSSALIGSVTGSSAANAVMTGSYTIPIMKKHGYRAETAAGIEAAASTGGQFMPPIMGAGAFLIASFTQTPYMDIVKLS
ncbi:MAG: TRAP transporter large permease subunit, partial [Sphaerochaetaceae bacterium]